MSEKIATIITDLNIENYKNTGDIGRPGKGVNAEIFNSYDTNVASGKFSHAEGVKTSATATAAHAEGGYITDQPGCAASAYAAHAEGISTVSCGKYSHAEGACSIAAGRTASHAEGASCIAAHPSQLLKVKSYNVTAKTFTFDTSFGSFSDAFANTSVGNKIRIINNHFIGDGQAFTIASKNSSTNSITVTEDIPTSNFQPSYCVNVSFYPTAGYCQHAEGDRTLCSGSYGAHAEGCETIASGTASHAEGNSTVASGKYSHAEGDATIASGAGSHAEGYHTRATEWGAHAEGDATIASGAGSHAEGCETIASGTDSHAGGYNTIASGLCQFVIGRFNVESSSEFNRFIIGDGTSLARANCFRVRINGVYASGAYNTSGADYAELFQWKDGNPNHEDRAGRFVTIDGEYIQLANTGDFILGIVSGNPSVVGDVYDDQWHQMFLTDIYGRPLYEEVVVPEETIEEEIMVPADDGSGEMITKKETRVVRSARTEIRRKLNPDYNNNQEYIPRSERPEWDAVGMLGKLVVEDDGTCEPNGYCTSGENGIATKSETQTKFRVMSRIDDSHIRVLVL